MAHFFYNGFMEKISVRWMMEEDLPEVRDMRAECGILGEIDEIVRNPDFICKVADISGVAVGFVAYKNSRKRVRVSEVAVHPGLRGMKVGAFILGSLVSADDSGSKVVEAMVSEENLKAQMLFKEAGFRAADILKRPSGTLYRFERSGED